MTRQQLIDALARVKRSLLEYDGWSLGEVEAVDEAIRHLEGCDHVR